MKINELKLKIEVKKQNKKIVQRERISVIDILKN